ncbi:uncharacterized protein LOC107174938 [Citrus sinensis]|uniref:uncharacterized protein LOC107174938 n=1 Tax=Citrus sinensis TaxID=2711 RepID=UPI00076395CD|nr:uncharacterized protein LOC107174938 [Citrus sinensis]XP_024037037.1 uncharacterized protein LOC112097010 [Citrus x clementina]
MEVYVDDMITKSKFPKEHVEHLEETFGLLRKYKMKLNPEKCAFGVESGKFLRFMVSHRGIEANPEKIQAIVQMRSLRNLKETQSLTGRLATLHKPDASGWLVKWAIELSKFDIDSKPRAAIKAQAVSNEDRVGFSEPEVGFDQLDAVTVSNEDRAEYEVLIAGLGLAKAVKADRVKIRTDSQLVANHVSERFQPRDGKMKQYLKKVRQMMGKFEAVEVIQIPMEQNSRADILAKMVAVTDPKMPKSIPLEVKTSPSIKQNLEVMLIEQKCSWMDPIISYIRDGVLPPNKLRARKIRAQASRYTMIDGVLYRRGYTLSFIRCLDEDDADYVLREIHEGVCKNHSGARSLAHKVLRQGYFWPTMHQDAQEKTRSCGIDLIKPLPKGRGTATHAKIPYALKTDNGRQFDNHNFRDFCQNLGIELKYCSPAHLQSNGQVEVANKTIKRLLKTRLGAKKCVWVDELSGVLWAYKTTHKTATGKTPFALAFRHEAVVQIEIGMTTHRTDHFDEQENNDQMCLNPDLLTKKREQTSKRSAVYQQRVARYYNQKVNIRQFKVGDWVLRRVNQNMKDSTQGVLRPNWEGPYRVKQIVRPGAYKLVRTDGHEVKRPWKAAHLKKYFQ